MMAEEKIVPPVYVNAVRFQSGLDDFNMYMGVVQPDMGKEPGEEPETFVVPFARVIMSPAHFKRFVFAAMDHLNGYEQKYGEIPNPSKSDEK